MGEFPGKTVEVDYTEEPNVDLKDKKILSVLSRNCRLMPTQIGKQVGLSKEVVHYRIKNLEKKGILRGNITVLNPSKVGFQMFIVYLQTQNLSKEKENEIIHKLNQNPYTHYIFRCLGKFDIAFDIVAPSIKEFDNILREILQEFGKHVKHYETSTILDVLKYSHLTDAFSNDIELKQMKYVSDSSFMKFVHPMTIDYNQEVNSLDEADMKLLYFLSNNSTLQLKQLSGMVSVSADTVKYRIKGLIDKNIILGFMPIINLSMLGYHTYLVLLELNNVSFNAKNKILSYLSSHEDVIFCLRTSGQYEITLNATVKNNLHLNEFISALKRKYPEQIKTLEMFLILRDYKIAFLPKI
jgi:DNA-binding Lrp family transcriptional regulator